MSLEELKGQMVAAVAEFQKSGDMSLIQAVSKAMDKAKAELAKEQAAKLLAESVALAGKREALEAKVKAAVATLGLDKELEVVKSRGFSYYIKTSYPVPGEPDVTQQLNCGLILATVPKTHKGGGGSGKLKAITGLSRWEIIDKYATADEQEKLAAAGEDSRSRWFTSEPAIKRILNEHPELIKK